uniref:Uncharacterized protein n=1 Tax=Arundo donax TaxID=35708 RepID=A0A0A9A580_ARUDO
MRFLIQNKLYIFEILDKLTVQLSNVINDLSLEARSQL